MRVQGKGFAQGGRRVRIQGMTYGPFAPGVGGEPFPSQGRARADFAAMHAIGVNCIRIYHVPPDWFLDLADEFELGVFIDVPWPKHLCFLDSPPVQRAALGAVRRAAELGRSHPCVQAYIVGNEIPPNIVRWHGVRQVERFLSELYDATKQIDPDSLVTYANFPSTEYLDLSFFDFATFNVYLHDPETFRRYLVRLQNLVGDRPLVLGELGMDSLRHGEDAQAHFLAGHLAEAARACLAGAFVFSWTDDWFTGGQPIEDWAFGITQRDRFPKAAFHALRELFAAPTADLLTVTPRVSVVVCSYNGGQTLDQCLQSLAALDYPDYEVIVVDDGSTDDTAAILARHPDVRAIRQPNRGLSVARNTGLHAATGAVVAYTDSDCFAEPDWLTHLIDRLVRTDAAAVGGPNLTPEDGWLAACVAAAPGQPTHVLESDQVAEHVPGCNMAFRREALEAINGFDPRYRRAGDDVDVCWRLQQAGEWIAFAAGACVWHHRRQTPRAYLRQQAGYGEAEALLQFKHPDRFNGRGDGKWRGVLYGSSGRGLRLNREMIYRGTFGTGLFQCLYQPGPAHWAMLPLTLEWHLGAAMFALSGFYWPIAWVLLGLMLATAAAVAGLQAAQTILPSRHTGIASRLVVWALCYAQPIVRAWRRYRTRLFSYRSPASDDSTPAADLRSGTRTSSRSDAQFACHKRELAYWGEIGRSELLGLFIARLIERHWGTAVDSGWSDWDVEVHYHPWTLLRVCTAQEDLGGGKHVVRVRYRQRPTELTGVVGAMGVATAAVLTGLNPWLGAVAVVALTAWTAVAWRRGAGFAARAMRLLDGLAHEMGLIRLQPGVGDDWPADDSVRERT